MTSLVFLPAAVFVSLLIAAIWRKKRWLTGGNFLLAIYALTSLLGLVLLMFYSIQYTTSGILYYTGCLGIVLLPYVFLDIEGLPASVAANQNSVKVIFSGLAAMGLVSAGYWAPVVVGAFRSGIGDYRNQVYSTAVDAGAAGNAMMMLVGAWSLALPCAFYWLTVRGPSLLGLCLLLSGASNVFVGFAFGGRSGLITFLLSFLFLIGVIGARWGRMIAYRVPLYVGSSALAFAALFYSLWVADQRDLGSAAFYTYVPFQNRYAIAAFSMLHYAGQSFMNFQDYWNIRWDNVDIYGGGRMFPFFFGLAERLGFIDDYTYAEIENDFLMRYEDEGLFGAVFCSFLREYIVDFGTVPTAVGCCCLSLVTMLMLKRYSRTRRLEDFLVVVFLAYIPLNGVLFSHMGSLASNGLLLLLPSTYLALRLSTPSLPDQVNKSPTG